MELKKVALNDIHEKLGAKMVGFAGFNMPVRYTSDTEEHMTVRDDVGVFDVSHMGEFFVRGPEALDLLQKITSNDVSKLFPGKAQYTCMPNDDGGIVDDLLIYMIAEEQYMMVVNASNIEKDFNWIRVKQWAEKCDVYNASDDYSLFAVQGPKATEVLQKITDIKLEDISFYSFEIGAMGGVDDVLISATGYTGSGGFELYVRNEDADILWKAVFEAGKEEGIKPIGLAARDTLRLEMGFCLYGNDIDDTTSPLEAGLGWITKFDTNFTNKENLLKQKEEGISKKLVGFELLERGIPRNGYTISSLEGSEIGHVTSGTMSPILETGIGMGYVQKKHSKPGTEILLNIRNKQIKAHIVKPPFI
ncbi:MAG: glycine cleavage system aminomethyltransferase GcvT [Bacteroidota bacterium]